MTNRRVVVTGAGGVTAFGSDWQQIREKLLAQKNAVVCVDEWKK